MTTRRFAGRRGAAALLLAALALAGCDSQKLPAGSAERSGAKTAKIQRGGTVPKEVGGFEGATPMADRVAVIALLNKRNGLVREVEMKPGDSIRIGRAIVRLRACETTAPWEPMPETGAFVQLTVQDQRDDKWYRVFSGWLFRERPDRNIIQHPIYDVFVKSCAMTYPGGAPVARPKVADPAVKASSAPQSPATKGGAGGAPAPAAAPAPASPEPAAPEPSTE